MKRKSGLDILRAMAILFVISVHFFKRTYFYKNFLIKGEISFFLLFVRYIFFICVPLFMLLTGYLNCNKEINSKHYKGIKKIISSYITISLANIFVRAIVFKEKNRILKWILLFFSFGLGYGWYVEMYIGLFLLIPFLNILYKNLESKKQKQIIILILLFLTSISTIVSSFKLLGLKLTLISNYWKDLYPFTYYFIGAYIREYNPKIPKKKLCLSIFITLLIQTFLTFVLNYNRSFDRSIFEGYCNLFTVIISVSVFLLFYNVELKNKVISKLITSISLVSFDMYLISYIVDRAVYRKVKHLIIRPIEYVKYFIPVVLTIILITYLLALFKSYLENNLFKNKKTEQIPSNQ